jgi:hypothetical protein
LYSWVALGLTAAVGLAAVGSGSYAVVHHADLKSGCGATATGCSTSDVDGLRAATYATDALIGIAAAAAVTTVVLFVVEARRHPAPRGAALDPAVRF